MTSVAEAEIALAEAVRTHAAAVGMRAAEDMLLSSFVVVAHWDSDDEYGYTLHKSMRALPPHAITGLLAKGEELLIFDQDTDE